MSTKNEGAGADLLTKRTSTQEDGSPADSKRSKEEEKMASKHARWVKIDNDSGIYKVHIAKLNKETAITQTFRCRPARGPSS